MDVYEATKIVLSRIKSLDPENATKIMGLLLLQDHGDKEIIRLAFGPEALIHSLVLKAHKELGLGLQSSANTRLVAHSPLAVSSPCSWPPPHQVFSRSNSNNSVFSRSFNELNASDELSSPSSFKSLPFGTELVDEHRLQDQVNYESIVGADDVSPYGLSGQSCAAAEFGLGVDQGEEFGGRPCLYFARGYCNKGSGCRFIHGLSDDSNSNRLDNSVEQYCHELLMNSRSRRVGSSQLTASAFPYSPRGSIPVSPSTPGKCLSLLLQQQQESQRIAEFMARTRIDRSDLSPAARQIYLTFPADSTFREEDVSSYFSIYGPVQDVRIPYQQKRMFGFVTFVYSETVKLILAKGNPHFVCDARVLVKPYKEKGKVYEKKHQLLERGDFTSCTSPTGLSLDSSADGFDFQQLGAKMVYNANNSQELLLRRKLEEQKQAAELQQAIELQQSRFMRLHLLGLKNRSSATAPVPIHTTNPIISTIDSSSSGSLESSSPEDKSPNGATAMDKKLNSCHGILYETSLIAADKQESNGEADPKDDGDYQESFAHNLPDSPFASPKKSMTVNNDFFGNEAEIVASNGMVQSLYGDSDFGRNLIASTIIPTSSTLGIGPLRSCDFQLPWFLNNGAIEM